MPAMDDDFGLTPANGYYPMYVQNGARPFCPPSPSSRFRCLGWMRTDLMPVSRGDAIPSYAGYTPADIQSAYGFNPKAGKGQTIVIVDAYGYTKAAADLAVYRQAAGVPPCTTGNGCLRILNQNGVASPLPGQPPASNAAEFGWVYEQSLDLDAVSAACPLCHIVLIEANDGNSVVGAVKTAMRFSHVVSMSFGSPEAGAPPNSGWPSSGYALVASAGDFGGGLKPQSGGQGGPEVPCVWTAVVCAGGTRLAHSGASWAEKVWNDETKRQCGTGTQPCGATGSGCSTIVPKPSWQHDAGCRMRSSADVSADASVFTPLAVYNTYFKTATYPYKWAGVGGTSLAAPLIAAAFALAGNAASRHGAMELWQKHNALKDIVKGTNVYVPVTGSCASSVTYICVAGAGYDGPTGWGSPKGTSNF
jgi:subtilase family serine protease